MLVFWMAAAVAAPHPWPQTVVQGLHRDGVWMTSDDLREALTAHCAAGNEGACSWAEDDEQVLHPDVHTVGRLLAPHCDDDPVACLAAGWALGTDDRGTLSSAHAFDPEQAMVSFEKACEGGLYRGCTAVARAHRHGVGTYASDAHARELLVEPCRRDEPRACRELAELTSGDASSSWLAAAVDLGDPVAAWKRDPSPAGTAAACKAGVVAACERLARDEPRRAVPALASACTFGHQPSCARRLAIDDLPDAERADALRAIAERWPPAAGWASLARYGGRIHPWPSTQEILEADVRSLPTSLHRAIWPCYVESLLQADRSGWADVTVQFDPDGEIVGAAMEGDWVPESLSRCAFTAAQGAQKLHDGTGPLVLDVRVPFAHQASFKLRPLVENSTRDLTTAADSMVAWSDAVEQCLVGRGEMILSRPRLRLKIRPSGEVAKAKLERSSGLDAVDLCLVETLEAQHTKKLVTGLPVSVELALFSVAELEEEPKVRYRSEPVVHAGAPAVEKVLVLVLEGGEVDGKRARLGTKSVDSLQQAYDRTAAWVAEHSGGALMLDVELRQVDVALRQELGSDDRSVRWHVNHEDLPEELVRSIEPATWDQINLWAPLPRGAPQASLGVVWRARTLRGARFTSAALASGRELTMGDKPIELALLQGLYDHWVDRASLHLGATLPPNDRVLHLDDGTRRDPRPWTDDPMAFYEHLFHNDLIPSFWSDLTTYGDELNQPREGNLAYQAQPFATDTVVRADYINDGILVTGRAWASASDTNDDATTAAFGLRFTETTRVAEVEALLVLGDGATPTVTVQVARSGGWVDVASGPTDDAGRFHASFDPLATEAVQLLVEHPSERSVIELAAFGPEL